jgi:hypothetical protein
MDRHAPAPTQARLAEGCGVCEAEVRAFRAVTGELDDTKRGRVFLLISSGPIRPFARVLRSATMGGPAARGGPGGEPA